MENRIVPYSSNGGNSTNQAEQFRRYVQSTIDHALNEALNASPFGNSGRGGRGRGQQRGRGTRGRGGRGGRGRGQTMALRLQNNSLDRSAPLDPVNDHDGILATTRQMVVASGGFNASGVAGVRTPGSGLKVIVKSPWFDIKGKIGRDSGNIGPLQLKDRDEFDKVKGKHVAIRSVSLELDCEGFRDVPVSVFFLLRKGGTAESYAEDKKPDSTITDSVARRLDFVSAEDIHTIVIPKGFWEDIIPEKDEADACYLHVAHELRRRPQGIEDGSIVGKYRAHFLYEV